MRPTPRPQLVAVLVSGAEGASAPRKRSEATPAPPPRAVLFYTLSRTAPALTHGESIPSAVDQEEREEWPE